MIKIGRRVFIRIFYILIDIFFLGLSIYCAALIRHVETLPFDVSIYNLFVNPKNDFRFVFYCWFVVMIYLNNVNRLYETRREIFELEEIWNVFKSSVFSSLLIVVIIYISRIEYFPRSVFLLIAAFMMLTFSLWRMVKKVCVSFAVSRGYNNFNVLIIGANKVGQSLVKEIRKRPQLGLNVLGFIDDYVARKIESLKLPVLGTTSDFGEIAKRQFIDKVFIVGHYHEDVFMDILQKCKRQGIAVRVVPHGYEFISSDVVKFNIGIIPVLEYSEPGIQKRQPGKRLFDFAISLLLFLALLPIFIVIAIKIKMDSPGPVFYLSRRFGRGGKPFNMYKFRSMRQDADVELEKLKEKNEVDGPIFKMKDDPRVTEFGKFIRKYSLDELPQILNVLKGDMSLVGPRPFPLHQVQQEDLKQWQRLEVRPGITGLWQVKGRSDVSFARLVRWDSWYIDNWSFGLDLNILFQTIPVVIKGRGAY